MNKLRLSGILSDLGSEIGVHNSSFAISYNDHNGSDNESDNGNNDNGSNDNENDNVDDNNNVDDHDNDNDNDDASFVQVDNIQPSPPSNSLSILTK